MAGIKHKNNFEFLRLIFALFVIVTHSYELSGRSYFDFLFAHSDFQLGFSYIGVRGFFIISGYLVFQILLRSKGPIDYFWKRGLRIFPGLLVVLIVTVVLVGPFVYDPHVPIKAADPGMFPTATVGPYWSNPEVWSYVPRNASLYALQPAITGVFEHNVYPWVINGSLWTICYEFTCYLALAGLFFIRRWGQVMKVALVAVWLLLFIGNLFYFEQIKRYSFFINFGQMIEFASYFMGGVLLAVFQYEKFRWINWMTLAALVILVASILTGHFLHGFHFVFMPLLVIGFGIRSTPILRDVGEKIGDISYGIYIYAFLVQQTLMCFFVLDYISLFFVTTPITIVLGYISWHLIEKRALRLKNWQPWRRVLRPSLRSK